MPNIYPNKVEELALVAVAEPPTKGNVILLRLEQPENAEEPMLVTLSGIVILVRLEQPENAEEPMLVTLPSVGITLFLHPAIKVLLAVSIKQFPAL